MFAAMAGGLSVALAADPQNEPTTGDAGAGRPQAPAIGESKLNVSTDLADLSLEQLIQLKVGTVYGAARQWQQVSDVPSQVTIVTSEEIKLYGYRTLADVLRASPGFYVYNDRNYSYFGVRGFKSGDFNTRILLLIDGHRMNDGLQDAAFVGNEFLLDIDLVDRIEIIQGPGSSIYGNNAFFGIVSVITKKGRDYQGGEVSGEVQSYDTYKARFSFGKKYENGVEFLVSGTYFDSQGVPSLYYPEFASTNSNNGYAVNVDGEQYYSLFGTVTWKNLTLCGGYIDREKVVPTASYRTVFNSDQNRTWDSRGYVDLKFDRDLTEELNLLARAYYDYAGYDGDYLYNAAPVPPPDYVLNEDQFRSDSWGVLVQGIRKFGEQFSVTAGTEFRHFFSQQLQNKNVGSPPALDVETSTWDVGVYAEGEARVGKVASFTAGLRYDYFETFGDTLNPRLSTIVRPQEGTVLKFLVGSSYRAPNATELFYSDGGFSTKPSPGLDPETIDTYQAVWEQRLPGEVQLGLAGFFYHVDNLIAFQVDRTDGLLHYVNVGEVNAYGAQLQLQRRWDWGLRLEGHYSYQNAYDAKTGDWLTSSPRNLAGVHAAVPLLRDKIFAAVEFQYVGSAQTLAGTETDPSWIFNLTLYTQRLIKNVEFSASLYNLFNQQYDVPGGSEHVQVVIPQDGRSFRFKLTMRF